MKKRKHFMTAVIALMMVALPVGSVTGGVLSTSNTNMLIASAENTAVSPEDNYLKDGDIVHIKKTDFNCSATTLLPIHEIIEVSEDFYVYYLKLDESHPGVLIPDMIVSVNDEQEFAQEFDIAYDSQHPCIARRVYMDKFIDKPDSTRAIIQEYWILKPTGGWTKYAYTHNFTPESILEVTATFNRENLQSAYRLINPDAEINVYRNGEKVTTLKRDEGFTYVGVDGDEYTWDVDVKQTIYYSKTAYITSGKISGVFIGDMPYVTGKDLSSTYVLTDGVYDNADGTPNIFDVTYPKTDSNGNIIYDKDGNPVMVNIKDINHGDAQIIKNTEVVQTIKAVDLDYGSPVLQNYDKNATYFLKVAVDKDNSDYIFFKYNEEGGWWDFRVNTADTPIYKAPINLVAYSDEYAGGVLYNKKSADGGYDGFESDNWSKADFAGGEKTVSILTNDNNYTYTTFFDYGKQGGAYYQYVGIDPVLVNTYGERAKRVLANVMDVQVSADAGDHYTIGGTDSDGNKIAGGGQFQFPNDTIRVPIGNVEIVNTDTGIRNEVTDGEILYKDEEEEKKGKDVANLSTPVTKNEYLIADAKGNVISEGELKNTGELNNLLSDTNIPSKQVDYMAHEVYYKFENTTGIVNSVDKDALKTDKGYFIFDKSATAQKGDIIRLYLTGVVGDVNQDSKFNIADAVLEQRYILGGLTSKDNYTVKSYIASDVATDGYSDTFDMVVLRQMLTDQSKK